jgi:hypothetical protein
MKRPAVSKFTIPTLVKASCAVICLGLLFAFGGATRAQQGPQKLVVKSDKNNPRKAPEKSAQKRTGNTAAASSQQAGQAPAEPTTNSITTNDTASSTSQAVSSSPSGCDYGTILVRDTIRIIFVDLFNYPPNSAIPVTMTQTNAGTIGFAMTDQGPFTPTLNIVVNTDGNGNGESAPVFTQGLNLGPTTFYGDTPYGSTTVIDFNVLPQCNCPPIPVIQ